MKKVIAVFAIIISSTLTGCASLTQAYSAGATATAVGLKAAEDNSLATLKFGLCATPYSAIIRHPELVPGIGALCLPSGVNSNPANLLTTIPAKK